MASVSSLHILLFINHIFCALQGHKKLTGNTSSDRYRLLISDGLYSNSYAMLATQLNHMVENKQLEEFTIIRVNRLLTSMVNNNNQQKGEK